ncbi:helix-turn-helix domain-containing protein [bacterium]|nr:helix-turn-helix domain-containing protein [bacterium]
MSDHMKTRPTNRKENNQRISVTIPASKRVELERAIQKLGGIVVDESIPWQEALGENTSGEQLKSARGIRELTQVSLSELTDIPRRHISEMESGKRPIGKVNAKKLAGALNFDYRLFL